MCQFVQGEEMLKEVSATFIMSVVLPAILFAGLPLSAEAVPSFARQTGAECASCHTTGFSVLSPFGRQFKLRAYSLGESNMPLVIGGVVSQTRSRNSTPVGESEFKSNSRLDVQRLSTYFAGKIAANAGAFVNWNYDGIERRGSMEMVDVRYATDISLAGKDVLVGVTLNNNPTVSDIFNSTPAFGFPQISPSGRTVVTPNAMAQIDMSLASQVAGVSTYAWLDNSVYAEIGAYRTADKMFSILRAGIPRNGGMESAAALDGLAPYWRLAYENQWGGHSLAAGAYGMSVDRYPDPSNPTGASDRFRDIGIDAQYQFIDDEHRVSSGLTAIRERQSWRASFDPTGMASMRDGADGALKTIRTHISYLFRKQYGATVGYFSTSGSADQMLYNTGDPITGSASGSPDMRGSLVEFSYIPQQNIRLALRYTGYSMFNGASRNYDGFGRDARDNNNLYLYSWFLF